MTKNNSPANDPVFLWRCIRTYAGYAIDQIEQGANVSPETLQDIRRAKDAAADALFSLLHEESSND